MDINTTEFNGLIKKIKRKKAISIAIFLISLAGIWFSIGNGLFVTLSVVLAVASFCSYVIVGLPTYNALYIECDARKHLIMLTAIEQGKNTYPLLMSAYFYCGDYDTSIHYAKRVYKNKSAFSKLKALYWIALNKFFLGNEEEFKKVAFDFQIMTKNSKLSKRQRKGILECHAVINLLLAINNKDNEKIKEFVLRLNIIKEDNKISSAFVNYLKGIAAYTLGDKAESTHRFMTVCDIASKTVLGTLAKRYLDKLNGENDTGGENL